MRNWEYTLKVAKLNAIHSICQGLYECHDSLKNEVFFYFNQIILFYWFILKLFDHIENFQQLTELNNRSIHNHQFAKVKEMSNNP